VTFLLNDEGRWLKPGSSGAARHFNVEFDLVLGAEHVARSAQGKLLEVIAGSGAANDNPIPDYLNPQPSDPSARSLNNPLFDRLFAFGRPQFAVRFPLRGRIEGLWRLVIIGIHYEVSE
jgi:hypothetical protein